MFKLIAFVAICAVAYATTPTAAPWKTGLNGDKALTAGENCLIFSELGKFYSENAKTFNNKMELNWVLSFQMQYLSKSEGGTASNRFKFEKGAPGIINQLERKSQNASDFSEVAQKYQKWRLTADGNIISHYNDHALAISEGNINPGSETIMWPVHPGVNLKWYMDSDRRICSRIPDANICLYVVADLRNGNPLRVRTEVPLKTKGGRVPRNQQWFIMCEPKAA